VLGIDAAGTPDLAGLLAAGGVVGGGCLSLRLSSGGQGVDLSGSMGLPAPLPVVLLLTDDDGERRPMFIDGSLGPSGVQGEDAPAAIPTACADVAV
jgi:hypothetical protein